jgi:hypothetical protein
MLLATDPQQFPPTITLLLIAAAILVVSAVVVTWAARVHIRANAKMSNRGLVD